MRAVSQHSGAANPASPTRLFLALWPDPAARTATSRVVARLHADWGGRAMRDDTLHLTLAFLGATPPATRAALLAGLSAPPVAPFALEFDACGYWPHTRIAWLRPRANPALSDLVAGLREQLHRLAVDFDARPFTPHVTLLRASPGGMTGPVEPVRWHVDAFALVASESGAHYRTLASWPLGGERLG